MRIGHLKFLAVWLLTAVILGAVFGLLMAIGVGLIIALGCVAMIRGASSSSDLQPGSATP